MNMLNQSPNLEKPSSSLPCPTGGCGEEGISDQPLLGVSIGSPSEPQRETQNQNAVDLLSSAGDRAVLNISSPTSEVAAVIAVGRKEDSPPPSNSDENRNKLEQIGVEADVKEEGGDVNCSQNENHGNRRSLRDKIAVLKFEFLEFNYGGAQTRFRNSELHQKIGLELNNAWTCLFCLHVRTAVLMYGIWHLILEVLALSILAVIISKKEPDTVYPNRFRGCDFLSTFRDMNDDELYIKGSIVMVTCSICVYLSLIYGTIRGKIMPMLPFFCLQVVDLIIITVVTFLNLRNIYRFLIVYRNLPLLMNHVILEVDWIVVELIQMLVYFWSMVWKFFWSFTVWRCCNYFMLIEGTVMDTTHYILPMGRELPNEPDYVGLMLDLEALCGNTLKQYPPPSIHDIMDNVVDVYLKNEGTAALPTDFANKVEEVAKTFLSVLNAKRSSSI